MTACSGRTSVNFMAREQPVNSTAIVTSHRHQGSSQRLEKCWRITASDGSPGKRITNHVVPDSHRHHESQAEEPTIAEDERPSNIGGKSKLNVPHCPSWEPRTGTERLRGLAARLQRCPPDFNVRGPGAHSGMPKCLEHGTDGLVLIPPALTRRRALVGSGGARQCHRGDAAEQPGWPGITIGHRSIVCGNEPPSRQRGICTLCREGPLQILPRKRELRRQFHHHAAYGRVRVRRAQRWHRHDAQPARHVLCCRIASNDQPFHLTRLPGQRFGKLVRRGISDARDEYASRAEWLSGEVRPNAQFEVQASRRCVVRHMLETRSAWLNEQCSPRFGDETLSCVGVLGY